NPKLRPGGLNVTDTSARRDLWYSVGAMRRLHVRVRVRWGWVEPFEAVLLERRPRRWATLTYDPKTKTTNVQWLPPEKVVRGFLPARTTGILVPMTNAQFDQWGPEPDAWQPIGPWPDPLPAPLPMAMATNEVRMVSIGRVKFDATAAAAEM